MTTLIITRGLPASGKSTWARDWVEQDPAHRAQVNRDTIREMVHIQAWDPEKERQVQAVRDASITALLKMGVNVVCSDTNLPSRVARDLRRLAVLAGAEFEVQDMTDVPLEECQQRNAVRQDKVPVPDEYIVAQYKKFIQNRPHPLPITDEVDPEAVEPYVPPFGKPWVILVDIDGTVALHGDRSPYDESRVHEDRPNEAVIAVVKAMANRGYGVIFCSGRTDACRKETEAWLVENGLGQHHGLFMRPAGDTRKDAIVKSEIFDREIRTNYQVAGVFDDRQQVVDMWRSMALTVFQVAPGDF